MPYVAHHDDDLCRLLHTMSLNKEPEATVPFHPSRDPANSSFSTSTPPPAAPKSYGCAYLQSILHSISSDQYPSTSGEYLDAIFTHREILMAHPIAHTECARAFTDVAYALETRAWRADRECDTEAVQAFRYEAWMIASTLAPVSNTKPKENGHSSCIMMPMM